MAGKKKKKAVVTRAWLLRLAKSIYDPKTRRYLRLCTGALTNGPDPENKNRKMHCGLGELYFALTGRHPYQDNFDEEHVVQATLEASTLAGVRSARFKQLQETIEKLNLRVSVHNKLASTADDIVSREYNLDDEQAKFVKTLSEIPDVNDGATGATCTASYRKRAQVVAAKLRLAASFLPA